MNIVFTTFNARYSHSSLSLRCLRANLGDLHDQSAILEFENRLSPNAAAEKILSLQPKVVLFSVYIWNLINTYETALILKTIQPDLKIIIGGPEVSHEHESSLIVELADHLVCGEGEHVIEPLCRDLLEENPVSKIIEGKPADLTTVELPYDEYTDEDIANRRIYVETSRGCPFTCEYCLSALEDGVRFVPHERIFPMFGKLIERGVRIFKFLDRSFNINAEHAAAILQFFLENRRNGMMLHLEWEPELLHPELEKILAEAPSGFIQLEVGVQTFNSEVAERIQRRLNPERVEDHLRRLTAFPSVHIHADLIAGLPGENLESLAAGFDRLFACGPDEIQLGILKKLRGAPIAKHDAEWEMVYNTAPPYDVLQTGALSFLELQKIRRFARFWDITVNNGRFPTAAPLLWKDQPSVFVAFLEWSEWLYKKTGSSAGIAPPRLGRFIESFLSNQRSVELETARNAVRDDLSARSSATKGMERQTRKENTKS